MDDEADFDRGMAKRGLDVPAEWRAGALCVHRELSGLAARLKGPQSPDLEPEGSFSALPYLDRPASR